MVTVHINPCLYYISVHSINIISVSVGFVKLGSVSIYRTVIQTWFFTLKVFVFKCVISLTSKTELSHFYSWPLLHSEVCDLLTPSPPKPTGVLLWYVADLARDSFLVTVDCMCVQPQTHTSRTAVPLENFPSTAEMIMVKTREFGFHRYPLF